MELHAFELMQLNGLKLKHHIARAVQAADFSLDTSELHECLKKFWTDALAEDSKRKLIVGLQSYVADLIPFRDGYLDRALSGEEWWAAAHSNGHACPRCGAPSGLSFSGNKFKLASDYVGTCLTGDTYIVEVNFPTGTVVWDDWPDRFSELYDAGIIKRSTESVSYLKGQVAQSVDFAQQNIFHAHVGNTCPPLFINSESGAIQIGGGSYSEESDSVVSDTPEFESPGIFCTDLWWVTMVDKQYYDELIQQLPEERDKRYYEKGIETCQIPPGRYRFTCHAVTSDDVELFATAERIGPAELKSIQKIG